MEAKWPFMLITFGLLFALGLTIAGLEKNVVMNNWDKRRCEIPVMMASAFFKPDSDPRTKTEFAKENFNFCMKTYVDNFMALFMAPINMLFGKQLNAAGDAVNALSSVRNIATTMYNTLLSFLDQYYRRFNASVYEMSRIVQYLRMAMRRANAMVVSMLYSGLTLFRGMLNTIQFVIKVIMIICGIMLAIIIILIFILFPVIPLILSVLGAIIGTVLALTMVISGDIAKKADTYKSGFCFSENTQIFVKDKDGNSILKEISQIKLGDELGFNCGKITTVIQMNGKDVPLYNLNGIFVSGTHLVMGTDNIWKSVSSDERAIRTNMTSDILYCFNTDTRKIPVYSSELKTNNMILFRDWEEINDNDDFGQYYWNFLVLCILNNNSSYDKWSESINISKNIPLVSSNTKIKTSSGFIEVKDIKLFETMVLDRNNKEQNVLGLIKGFVENSKINSDKWNTGLFEFDNGIWKKGKGTVLDGDDVFEGYTIITETGEFIIWDEDESREKLVRDFTDVGHKIIHTTYPFVAHRLRIIN